ncbi:MAG: hypothetical protein WBG95_03960 [Sulfitobacter sp.]
MSYPYIIWTMRRTGGTTLASLLATLSEHPGIQHEPFNVERELGHVTKAFAQSGDADQLRVDLQSSLAETPVIKHCYEDFSPAFNCAFMEVATALGYRHLVLDRRSETDRIISLELAKLTGAWGGKGAGEIYPAIEAGDVVLEPMDIDGMCARMSHYHAQRQKFQDLAHDAAVPPFVIFFEDVYSDPDAGRALITRLLAFLEIVPEDQAAYEALVSDALLLRGQNSARILQMVPNKQAVKETLDALQATQSMVFAAS